VGIAVTILILASGTYFPVEYFPEWVRRITQLNPITIALDASRRALLGSIRWSEVWSTVLALTPWAVVSLVAGIWAFRMALRRERRRGTMGMY
jgi:ABC-2 type transport system permease protein